VVGLERQLQAVEQLQVASHKLQVEKRKTQLQLLFAFNLRLAA
jgi:hypothetical protein